MVSGKLFFNAIDPFKLREGHDASVGYHDIYTWQIQLFDGIHASSYRSIVGQLTRQRYQIALHIFAGTLGFIQGTCGTQYFGAT